MSVKINPITLSGNWDLGYALDTYVINSIFRGNDEDGKPRFDNTYSSIGELLNQFKYRDQFNNLNEIVDTIMDFLEIHPQMKNIKTILPVPPSHPRKYQPTFEIAQALAQKMGILYRNDVLVKTSHIEAKSLSADEKKQLAGTIAKKKNARHELNILLIDDLFQTGTTLTQCVSVLRKDPNIDKIYVITVAKTKNQ